MTQATEATKATLQSMAYAVENVHPVLEIPGWLKVLVALFKFMPGVPGWIAQILSIVFGLIEKFTAPEDKKAARAQVWAKAHEARRTKRWEVLEPVCLMHMRTALTMKG